ncbi:MAG: hypothetical protein IPN81_09070 [Nitrosomonadales bacterium]|nr:hypothetical protein [Nitrosomonadales bacterium]
MFRVSIKLKELAELRLGNRLMPSANQCTVEDCRNNIPRSGKQLDQASREYWRDNADNDLPVGLLADVPASMLSDGRKDWWAAVQALSRFHRHHTVQPFLTNSRNTSNRTPEESDSNTEVAVSLSIV